MSRQETVKPILIPVEYGPGVNLDQISTSLMPDIHKTLDVHLKDWQAHAFETLRKGEDLVIKAPTGSGKTAAILSMLVAKPGAIILVIVPLTAIETEVVPVLQKQGIKAVVVSGDTLEEDPGLWHKVNAGAYNVVYACPEVLLGAKSYFSKIAGNKTPSKFRDNLVLMALDEAHTPWEWDFRQAFKFIGNLRLCFPNVPLAAMSATFAPHTIGYVRSLAKMKTPSRVITVNGRRANLNTLVSVMPPKNSIEPLLDRIPDSATCLEEIRKTVIFVDSVLMARSIARRLRSKLRKNLGDKLNPTTVVRTYYSCTDSRTKAKTIELFKNGDTRIVVATDAFSLGVNVRDIECAIQWGVNHKLTFAKIEQRIGRAARNPDMQGIGVVYAPKSLFFKFRKGLMAPTEKFNEETQVDGDGDGDGEWEDIVDDIAKEITADEGIVIDNRDSDLSQFTLPVERATMKKVKELLGTMYKKATQMKDADNEQRAAQRGRFQGRNRRPVDSIDPGVLFFLNSDGCRARLRLAYFGYPDIFQDHLQTDWCCDSCGKGLDLETTSTAGIKLATSVHFYTEIKPTKNSSQLPAVLLKPAQFDPVKPLLVDLLNKWRMFRKSKLVVSNPDIDPEMPLSFILPDPVMDSIAGSCNRQMSLEYLRTILVKAGVSLTSGTLREKDLVEIVTLMRHEVAKHLPASGSGQVDRTAVASRSETEASGNDQGTTSETIQTTLHPLATTVVPPDVSDRLPGPPQTQTVEPEIIPEPTSASVMRPEMMPEPSDSTVMHPEITSSAPEALKDSRVARSRSVPKRKRDGTEKDIPGVAKRSKTAKQTDAGDGVEAKKSYSKAPKTTARKPLNEIVNLTRGNIARAEAGKREIKLSQAWTRD